MINIIDFTYGMVPSYVDISLCKLTTESKQSPLRWLKDDKQDHKLWFMLYIHHQHFLSYKHKIMTDLKEFCEDHNYYYGDSSKNGLNNLLKTLDNMENYV